MKFPSDSKHWSFDQWESHVWANQDTSEFTFLHEKGDLNKNLNAHRVD